MISRNLSTGTLPLRDSSPSLSGQEPPSVPSVAASTNRNDAPRRTDRRVSSINNLAAIAAANRSATRLSGSARTLGSRLSASRSSLARDNSSTSLSFAYALTAVRDEFGDVNDDEDEFDIDHHTRAFTAAIHNAGTNAFGINQCHRRVAFG